LAKTKEIPGQLALKNPALESLAQSKIEKHKG
jgi:hypothetical protein